MERLTYRDENGDAKLKPYNGVIFDAYERLAQYEDTGLSPKEVREMMTDWVVWKQAESEGRLLVLPCKIRDSVYRAEGRPGKRRVAAHEIEKIEVFRAGVRLCFGWRDAGYECVDTECIGETIFLSRAEAEAALAKETDA